MSNGFSLFCEAENTKLTKMGKRILDMHMYAACERAKQQK